MLLISHELTDAFGRPQTPRSELRKFEIWLYHLHPWPTWENAQLPSLIKITSFTPFSPFNSPYFLLHLSNHLDDHKIKEESSENSKFANINCILDQLEKMQSSQCAQKGLLSVQTLPLNLHISSCTYRTIWTTTKSKKRAQEIRNLPI